MTKHYPIPLIILAFTFSSNLLIASPQVPDYIVFKGDTVAIYQLILEQYLQKQEQNESNRLFGLSFREGASFNCWRGYQAIYKIENDSFFLVDIIRCGERRQGKIDKHSSQTKMKVFFGDKVISDRVFIDWFSGAISFSANKKVLRWDGVFHTIYEKETVVEVAGGRVLDVRRVNNYEDDPAAINRKHKDRISTLLFRRIKRVRWKSIDDCDCSEKYLVTIGENGKVSKITMLSYQNPDSINRYWDDDEYSYCIRNFQYALKDLKFDIIKDKGKPISEDIYLEIWFESRRKIENWTR